jgi:hypothetical protein
MDAALEAVPSTTLYMGRHLGSFWLVKLRRESSSISIPIDLMECSYMSSTRSSRRQGDRQFARVRAAARACRCKRYEMMGTSRAPVSGSGQQDRSCEHVGNWREAPADPLAALDDFPKCVKFENKSRTAVALATAKGFENARLSILFMPTLYLTEIPICFPNQS